MGVEADFKQHLYRVCKDETLREFALDFFHDLSSKYEGKEFTKDEFATLVIDGKVVEQDVVVSLFKSKEKVSAQEIFTYLFINNIDKFVIRRRVPGEPDSSGGVDALGKDCTIARYRPRVQESIFFNKDLSIKEKIAAYKAKKDFISRAIRKHYKGVIYHELSHIFELETYDDRRFIRNEMSDRTFMKTEKSFVLFYGNDINKGLLTAIALGADFGTSVESLMAILRAQGATSISEILNEEYAQEIQGTKCVLNFISEDECDKRYVRKTRLTGNCKYNRDYDIATLVNIILGDNRVRFNSVLALDKLGNLNISEDVLNEAKRKIIATMEKDLITEEDKKKNDGLEYRLKELNSYDTITIALGISGGYGYNEVSPNGVTVEDYKVIVQGLLVESIKNDIIAQLNDPAIAKDKKFYERINKTLESIDSVLCYPNTSTEFVYTRIEGKLNYQDLKDIYTHIPARYASKNPDMRNVVAFAALIEVVGSRLESGIDGLEGMEEVMTFYQKQQEIDNKYRKHEEEAKYCIMKIFVEEKNLDEEEKQ